MTAPSLPTRKGSILVVEDDPVAVEMLVRPLERIAGYQCEPFSCVEDAIKRARRNELEMIIADIRLPGDMTGITMIRKLRAEGVGVPCLLVSAAVTDEDEAMARTIHSCRIVAKPIPAVTLVEVVEDMVERYKMYGILYGILATQQEILQKLKPSKLTVAYRLLATGVMLYGLSVVKTHPHLLPLVEQIMRTLQ